MLKVLLSLAHSKTTAELQACERGCGFDFEFNQATISKWLSIKEPLDMGDGFIAGGWLWQQCRVSQYDGKLFKPMQPATADYRFEKTTISPTDERIHRAIVEHSKFRRDATISVEIEHGGNVQEFSFPPSTSIQTFRKISLALRRDFDEGLKMYQEFCRYDGMGGR